MNRTSEQRGAEHFRLCNLAEVPEVGAAAFVLPGRDGFPFRVFIVRRDGRLFAYRNMCPHRRIPLDFDDGRFLNGDGTYILCTNHGALFRIEDGVCVAGPCVGAALSVIDVRVDNGDIYVSP